MILNIYMLLYENEYTSISDVMRCRLRVTHTIKKNVGVFYTLSTFLTIFAYNRRFSELIFMNSVS